MRQMNGNSCKQTQRPAGNEESFRHCLHPTAHSGTIRTAPLSAEAAK